MKHLSNERGFSLLEVMIVAGIISILAGVAVGVSSTIVRTSRGESGAQQLDAFLRRHREAAIARRRDIEIRFLPPNQVQSVQRAVQPVNPDPDAEPIADEELETMTFEGGITFWRPDALEDTPNGFLNGDPITLGGPEPVMLSSEGAFLDANGDPVNATITLGIENDPLTVTAVTVMGTTALIERFRWNGASWGK